MGASGLLAVAGSFVTAFAVLVGWLFHVGFLDGFDVPSDLFPQTLQGLLLNSYLAAVSIAARLLPGLQGRWLVIASIAVAVVLLLLLYAALSAIAIAWVERRSERVVRIANWVNRSSGNKSHAAVAQAALTGIVVFMAPYVVASALLLCVLPPLIGYSAGQWEAERVQRDLRCHNEKGIC